MHNYDKYLTRNDKELIENLKDRIKSRFPEFKKLYLFGSRAKGNCHKESDYDIVVVADKTNKEMEHYIIHLTSEFDFQYDVFLDIHLLTEKEFRWNPFFYEEVTKYGLPYE